MQSETNFRPSQDCTIQIFSGGVGGLRSGGWPVLAPFRQVEGT